MNNRKLYRDTKNKIFGGVCYGLSEHFAVDPVIIRAIFLIGALIGGSMLLVYLILWIMIPEKPIVFTQNDDSLNANEPVKTNPTESSSQTAVIIGVLLIFVGFFFIVNRFIHFDLHRFWPIILILAGIIVIFASFIKKSD